MRIDQFATGVTAALAATITDDKVSSRYGVKDLCLGIFLLKSVIHKELLSAMDMRNYATDLTVT